MANRKNGWTTVGHSAAAGSRVWQGEQEQQERDLLDRWTQDDQWPAVHKPLLDGAEAKKFDSRLLQPEFLGRGGFAVVERVTYRTVCLARKRIRQKRGFTIEDLRKEGLTMRKLSHRHVVKLIGAYALHARELCLLLWPAAVCTLGELLDDIESLRLGQGDRNHILDNFERLGLDDTSAIAPNPVAQSIDKASTCPLEYLRSVVGCTVQALAHCHNNDVRHLDIKPSNVLMMPGRVYLSDFGVSRDVSEQDHTTTEGLPGTEKWRAPELYDLNTSSSMQLSDVYSLGLVYLNVATVLYNGRLDEFDKVLKYSEGLGRVEQIAKRESLLHQFIEHLTGLALVIPPFIFTYDGQETVRPRPLLKLIQHMISPLPSQRPSAARIDVRLSMLGGIQQIYHGACCKRPASWVEDKWDRKLASLVALQQENERQRKKIEELEGRDRTYEMRIENERKVHEQHMLAVQKRLKETEIELRHSEARNCLKASKGSRKPASAQTRRSGLDTEDSSGQDMYCFPARIPHRPPLQIKSRSTQSNPTIAQNRLITPPVLRTRTEPVTRHIPSLPNLSMRSNGSASRIPLPITPVRSSTPSLNCDPNSTDSSLVSSIFSTKSVETNPTPIRSSIGLSSQDDGEAMVRLASCHSTGRTGRGSELSIAARSSHARYSAKACTETDLEPDHAAPVPCLKRGHEACDLAILAKEQKSWADVLRYK